jgi:hypothetical protein
MMRINVPIAPQDRPWMWASGHNGHRRIHRAPTHGSATREAAMADLAHFSLPQQFHGRLAFKIARAVNPPVANAATAFSRRRPKNPILV